MAFVPARCRLGLKLDAVQCCAGGRADRSGKRLRLGARLSCTRMTRLEIVRMGRRGEAVAEAGGKPVYVPFALPGEIIEAEIDGERGTLRDIIIGSPDRVAPFCRHFGLCGGCLLQHWQKDAYRTWKRSLVE